MSIWVYKNRGRALAKVRDNWLQLRQGLFLTLVIAAKGIAHLIAWDLISIIWGYLLECYWLGQLLFNMIHTIDDNLIHVQSNHRNIQEMCSSVYQSYINKGSISAKFYEYIIFTIFATVMTTSNLSASLLKQTWLSVNILLYIEILIFILTGDKYGTYTLYILWLEHERRT